MFVNVLDSLAEEVEPCTQDTRSPPLVEKIARASWRLEKCRTLGGVHTAAVHEASAMGASQLRTKGCHVCRAWMLPRMFLGLKGWLFLQALWAGRRRCHHGGALRLLSSMAAHAQRV